MKQLTIIAYTGAAAGLAALGVTMAKTNPGQVAYEEYAVQRLASYLKTDVCKKTTNFIENLIRFNCEKLVDQANPQMQEIINRTTERQNYIFFSIYRTDLQLSSWVPSYKFETVGAFDQFYTFTAEQQ
ncbi:MULTISPECIES: DUF4359 domain-containing protein [Nostoc]|uniref:DUF4359 domain-containing protein n=1 Tax=Nostoc paludosum FACHB-159 TaxID=2692908 RepID=A0ABR8K2K3_9NOSO|nr:MULTISPECIES: DUF4359 domain-containing protein [Nostoc]MBD2677600.1 DUF4359 domain-containing protein [Nostoc sp. FACHB-857]MBD2733648.1 DUF4359 domain-containing protein [Nostoc paludosum FACHB-159]